MIYDIPSTFAEFEALMPRPENFEAKIKNYLRMFQRVVTQPMPHVYDPIYFRSIGLLPDHYFQVTVNYRATNFKSSITGAVSVDLVRKVNTTYTKELAYPIEPKPSVVGGYGFDTFQLMYTAGGVKSTLKPLAGRFAGYLALLNSKTKMLSFTQHQTMQQLFQPLAAYAEQWHSVDRLEALYRAVYADTIENLYVTAHTTLKEAEALYALIQ